MNLFELAFELALELALELELELGSPSSLSPSARDQVQETKCKRSGAKQVQSPATLLQPPSPNHDAELPSSALRGL